MAGATFVPDMIRPLQHYHSLYGDLSGAALIYSGEETTVVDGIRVVPYTQTANLLFIDT